MSKQQTEQQRYLSFGIGVGVAVGCGLGIIFGNLALGIGPGIAIGVAYGIALGKKRAAKSGKTSAKMMPVASNISFETDGYGAAQFQRLDMGQ